MFISLVVDKFVIYVNMHFFTSLSIHEYYIFVLSYFPTMKNSDKTLPRTPTFDVLGRFCMSFLFISVCS